MPETPLRLLTPKRFRGLATESPKLESKPRPGPAVLEGEKIPAAAEAWKKAGFRVFSEAA